MPAGTDESLFARIEALLSEGTAEARGPAAAVEELPSILTEAFSVAADAWAGSEGVAAGAAAAGAASGLGAFALLIVLAALVIAVYLVLWLVLTFARSVEGIGPFGIGKRLAFLITLAAHPLVSLTSLLTNATQDALHHALEGFVGAVHWAMVQGVQTARTPLETVITAQIEPLHREVDRLWGWVQTIATDLSGEQTTSAPVAAPAPSQSPALLHRIEALESRNDHQGLEISSLNQRVSALTATLSVVQGEVEHLRITLYGARASVVGVQDVVHQLDVLQTTIEHVQATQGATIQTHTQALDQLAPLLTLLYLGERGLTNLRTLEQDMCQCPRLPRVGFMFPDALALEQAVAHGF